jgi:uncharacterized protein YpuA (DUF1002 family)
MLAVGLLFAGVLFASTTTHADTSKNEDGTYNITNDIFTYGWSLTTQQMDQTREEFGISNRHNPQEIKVTGTLLAKYMPELGFTESSGAWSSAYITPSNEGGVHVKILGGITTYTELQSQNALITAGASNIDVKVYSPKAVEGQGALTGMMIAFDKSDSTDDATAQANREANRKVAQQELDTLGNITDENKDKSGYSDAALNKAVSQMKSDVVNESKAKSGDATKDDIASIVNSQIKDNGLDGIVNDSQKQQLTDFLYNFQNSPAANNKDLKKQLNNLKDEASSAAKKAMDKAKGLYDDAEKSGVLDKIGEFFNNLFTSIKNIFGK